jgi:hydroxylamine reductase
MLFERRKSMKMFCYQCEQTMKGTGCTSIGVCGKEPQVSALMDLLLHALKFNSRLATRLNSKGFHLHDCDVFTIRALFATITNVNFDERRFVDYLREAKDCENKLRDQYLSRTENVEIINIDSGWEYRQDASFLEREASKFSFSQEIERMGETAAGLYHFVLYGLKGVAAYADHARLNGVEDNSVYAGFHEVLDFLWNTDKSIDELFACAINVGKLNLKVMEMLDEANCKFGKPEPTQVRITPIKGKCILMSGHDLVDLHELLKQTDGKGINVYTHGEMLPANAYPKLKAFKHLAGNYGSAWQNQQTEFAEFPGPIVLTTNCLMRPRPSYQDRLYTMNEVGFPGIRHVHDRDFSEVIDAAQKSQGFLSDSDEKKILVGFGKDVLISSVDTVIDLVKAGKLRHAFLIGGCDGSKPGRNYYTDFAKKVPQDCVILTLACGKYRFNKLEFGNIDGLPRLLDCGQCNDSYSAVRFAIALADKLGTDVNSLPLSLILSWFEQKAICVLLTLLYLGIKNIRIGPSAPAPIKEPVFEVLAEKFGIKFISTPEADLKEILG